ncbi:hypothetical protein WJX72_006342 [[Myrmecia] bisecta]|uniref:Subtilisin n=1 Tax=[Myrmecia] bisecta TaxID=41462 RepID=A0AAW1R6B6_9CHLO
MRGSSQSYRRQHTPGLAFLIATSCLLLAASAQEQNDADGVPQEAYLPHVSLQPLHEIGNVAGEGSSMHFAQKGNVPLIRANKPKEDPPAISTSHVSILDLASSGSQAAGKQSLFMVVFIDGTPASHVTSICDHAPTTYGFTCEQEFVATFTGFTAKATEAQMTHMLNDDQGNIAFVREDEVIQLHTKTEVLTEAAVGADLSKGLYGLDRIDQRSLPRDYAYNYNQDGTGVHIYVVDTGINPSHSEFKSSPGSSTTRVGNGFSYDGSQPTDCNGHGTHIAATAAGLTYGVAKGATIHPVRVIDCDGTGSISQIIQGLEWIYTKKQLPAVVLMSLGGPKTLVLDQACQALIDAGVNIVVAAGNDGGDACANSPARQPSVIAVGAVDSTDAMTDFSDSGACVDVLAPGQQILSANYKDNNGYMLLSGTSMSAPHVVGVAAMYLQANPTAQPYQVQDLIISSASWGKVGANSLKPSTANAIVNSNLFDPLVTTTAGTNGSATADRLIMTDTNYRNGYTVSTALAAKPAGQVTVYPTVDDSIGRLAVQGTSKSLVFTPDNWNLAQQVGIDVVRNRDQGYPEFTIDFYLTASSDPTMDGSRHKMHVFDKRTIPGETVDFPALITQIPFIGSGTTVNLADNYQATTCTGQSSTPETQGSPDFVYAFQPTEAVHVSVSTCGSAFDTKLIVYSRTSLSAPIQQIACNDDYCDLASYLELDLVSGTIYYVVVTGFNGAAGQFRLDFEPKGGATVAGAVIGGLYAPAAAGDFDPSSANSTVQADPPPAPVLIDQAWGPCECGQGMQDVTHVCHSGYTVVPLSVCVDATLTPRAYQTCNNTCTKPFNYAYQPYGICKNKCGGGVESRASACVTSANTPAAAGQCSGNAVEQRSCGTNNCTFTTWQVSAWGPCSKGCVDGSGPGQATRTVQCYQYGGSTLTPLGGPPSFPVEDNLCMTAKPANVTACNADRPCDFCSGKRGACSGHGNCSSSAAACVCDFGWKGYLCNIPTSCKGFTDAKGACCEYELSRSGQCCQALDRNMDCCASGRVDANGVCDGPAQGIDFRGLPCNGVVDAGGQCCGDGIVDNFGVCNGFDSSGPIRVTLNMPSTESSPAARVAGILGIDTSNLGTVSVSAPSSPKATTSTTSTRHLLQNYHVPSLAELAAAKAATLQQSPPSTTFNAPAFPPPPPPAGMTVQNFDVASQATSSKAITSTGLTVGQVQYLLNTDPQAASYNVLSVEAVSLCGNSICELGERPTIITEGASPKGGCPGDCPLSFSLCPIPTGSLSMCGGSPRGICVSGTGACICSTGYAGFDCGECQEGYYREGTRCMPLDNKSGWFLGSLSLR